MSSVTGHRRKQSLTVAFWLNVTFAVIEIAGAFATHSTAIFADAIHDLGDSLAIGLGLVFEKIAQKRPDARYTYGYKRYSLLSAMMLSIFLISGSVVMVYKAIDTFMHPHEVNSEGVLWLSILGIAVNGLAFMKIRMGEQQNYNSRAVMLHFLEDVLGWVAVLAGSIVMYYTRWFWIDGVLSIAIALFIAYNAVHNIRETALVFLQAAPSFVNIQQLKEELLAIEGVMRVEHLHVWSLDENETIGTVTVIVSPTVDHHYSLQKIRLVMNRWKIERNTVQIEFPGID